jgi:hypothetical protein
MKSLRTALVLLSLGFAAALSAVEVAGVPVPETVSAGGKTLKLNGAGLRKKFGMVKVYVLALYLETPSKDAAAVISSDEVKSARLSMRRSVAGEKIAGSIAEGFERNSKSQLPALKSRLERFAKMFPDLKEGDEVVVTYVPGTGTKVSALGTDRGTIEGRDFADALFSVWLGPDPVQEDLKKALLGG